MSLDPEVVALYAPPKLAPEPAPSPTISDRLLPPSTTPLGEKPSLEDVVKAAKTVLYSAPVFALVSVCITYATNYANAQASTVVEHAAIWATVAGVMNIILATWNQFQTGPKT